MSSISQSLVREPEHSASVAIEQAREFGETTSQCESSKVAGSNRNVLETMQEHQIQTDQDEEIIELKNNCPQLIDLTSDHPYEFSRATPSPAPIKDEFEHQPSANSFLTEPNLEMTSNTHPIIGIEEDDLDFSGFDIDAHERAIRSEAIAKRLDEAGFQFSNALNVNQPARSPVHIASTQRGVLEEPAIPGSDEEDTMAAKKFNDFRKKYERRKKRDNTTFSEDIDYTRACQAEATRLRRLEQKQARAEYEHRRQISEDSNDIAMFFPEKVEVSRKPERAKSSRIPAKVFEESMHIGRPANSKHATPRSKVSQSRVSKPRNSAKSRRGKKQNGPQMTNIDSLYHDDIIADALANRGKEAQPTFRSKRRKEALHELIASVPEQQRSVALADKRALDEACKSFTGRGTMSADGKGGWLLKGMCTSLYHYQLLGAAFMRERENAARRPFGGLQSDCMGLGKTVMTIANIVDGSVAVAPHPERNLARTTLIICPAGLCSQWFAEIKKHCLPDTLRDVMVYRAGSRIHSSDPKRVLESHDVVICSYGEILRSYPFANAPKHLSTEEQKDKWWKEHYENKVGPLHQINWRRIVLDEAQQIKSRTSKTFKSVCALAGKFRWAISGTPIMNSLDELFPFFSFLKVEHTGNYETFKHNYLCKDSENAHNRLHSQLRSFMIRRNHSDQMFNRPLLILPDINRETVTVEFNDCERAIYRIVRNRFIEKIRAWAKAGHLDRSYQSVFVLFLRLRQLVSHVLLIQRTLTELLLAEDLEKLWRMTEVEQMPAAEGSLSVLSQLKKMLVRAKQTAIQTDDNYEPQSQAVASDSAAPNEVDDSGSNLGGSFGTVFKFRRYLRHLRSTGKWDEANSRSLCHKCDSVPEDAHLTSCQHLYCKECLSALLYTAQQKGEENVKCLACDSIFHGSAPCRGFEEAGYSIDPRAQEPSRTARRSSSTSIDDDINWITSGERILPSAKTTGCKAQILAWLEAEPDCKIIVFSQFTPMLRILERICREEGWQHEQFHGGMSYEARDKAIRNFSDKKGPMILLAGLKAGGSGLNLVMASKVLLVDLWWNISVEDQAFCRVFRIGQTRRVDVTRLVVKDTIDDDIMAMQEFKKKQVDSVMEAENQPGKLTINELLKLFGPLQMDPHTGQVKGDEEGEDAFIFVEDEFMNDDSSDRDIPIKTPRRPF